MNSWLRTFGRNRKATLGGAILLGFVFLMIFGPLLVQDPTAFLGVPHSPPS